MRAPTSHMIKDTPTLPDDRRMLLGVAYILFQRRSVRVHRRFHRFTTTHPAPITELKIRKIALTRPTEWLIFNSNTTGSNGNLTQLSFVFRDVVIRFPIIPCIEYSLGTCNEVLWTMFLPSCSFLCNATPSAADPPVFWVWKWSQYTVKRGLVSRLVSGRRPRGSDGTFLSIIFLSRSRTWCAVYCRPLIEKWKQWALAWRDLPRRSLLTNLHCLCFPTQAVNNTQRRELASQTRRNKNCKSYSGCRCSLSNLLRDVRPDTWAFSIFLAFQKFSNILVRLGEFISIFKWAVI